MRTARRFVGGESGMTLALALIMIVIIGAMGAGLLAFVNRDLVTVVEENRGQRAFEVADAGIQAAKRQLANVSNRTIYDGNGEPTTDNVCGNDDTQWSGLRCGTPAGLTLQDLDGDGDPTDSVNVIIYYRSDRGDFRVVSTGTYGNSKRRIEAIFKGIEAGAGGGEDIGHPVYYTPSSIKIMSTGSNPVQLNQTSLFSRGDILIQSVQSYPITNTTQFGGDFSSNNTGAIRQAGGDDKLCDWDSKIPVQQGCFQGGTDGPWNTMPRPNHYAEPGMAAEGKICSFGYLTTTTSLPTAANAGICSPAASSIADGLHGFDSTTIPKFEVKPCQLSGSATCPDNDTGPLSYPFPLPRPIPSGLKAAACHPPGTNTTVCPKTPPPVSYFEGNPSSSTWGLDNTNASNSRITFIDAQNKTLVFQPSDQRLKGIIAVWCGRVELNQDFEGIIMLLVGNSLEGNTSCAANTPTVNRTTLVPDGKTVGTFENTGKRCQCWVYAEGGTPSLAGIQLDPGSIVQFRPSQDWSFQDGLFQGPPPTNFKLQSWRELYQASP